jgi:hypothetical protein
LSVAAKWVAKTGYSLMKLGITSQHLQHFILTGLHSMKNNNAGSEQQ